MKKGELSMSMIIGAVIAIIILVIIIFLVARGGGDANIATACPSKGGICTENYCADAIYDNGRAVRCPDAGTGLQQVCCNPLSIGN